MVSQDDKKDKALINAFIEKYKDNQYFIDTFFNSQSTDDILGYVGTSDVYDAFGDDILDEVPERDLIAYIEDYGYEVIDKGLYKELIQNTDDEIQSQILSIYRKLSKNKTTDKNDIKNTINEYIDFWFD